MRAAHDRLVTAIHRERALLGEASRLSGTARARLATRYRAQVHRDALTARADGYPRCA
jgi:hypothetical protein